MVNKKENKKINILELVFKCMGYGLGVIGIISTILTGRGVFYYLVFISFIIITFISTHKFKKNSDLK
jgi:hypothetical protein